MRPTKESLHSRFSMEKVSIVKINFLATEMFDAAIFPHKYLNIFNFSQFLEK